MGLVSRLGARRVGFQRRGFRRLGIRAAAQELGGDVLGAAPGGLLPAGDAPHELDRPVPQGEGAPGDREGDHDARLVLRREVRRGRPLFGPGDRRRAGRCRHLVGRRRHGRIARRTRGGLEVADRQALGAGEPQVLGLGRGGGGDDSHLGGRQGARVVGGGDGGQVTQGALHPHDRLTTPQADPQTLRQVVAQPHEPESAVLSARAERQKPRPEPALDQGAGARQAEELRLQKVRGETAGDRGR